MLGADKSFTLVVSDGKLIGSIHGNEYGITLDIGFGTDMGSLD